MSHTSHKHYLPGKYTFNFVDNLSNTSNMVSKLVSEPYTFAFLRCCYERKARLKHAMRYRITTIAACLVQKKSYKHINFLACLYYPQSFNKNAFNLFSQKCAFSNHTIQG